MKSAALFLTMLTCVATALLGRIAPDELRRRMFDDLDYVRTVFDVKYAPRNWKSDFANWDLDREVAHAKERVASLARPTVKGYHRILRDFLNSARDYHVNPIFYSTELATLPFTVTHAEGRYFVAAVYQSYSQNKSVPLHVGDELLIWDGRPIADVIRELQKREFGQNTYETDHALASTVLTERSGAEGHDVPSGRVTLAVRRQQSKRVENVHLEWDYTPEMVRDLANVGTAFEAGVGIRTFRGGENWKTLAKQNQFFHKEMVAPSWQRKVRAEASVSDPTQLGAWKSFLPPIGEVLWETDHYFSFHSYIFPLGDDYMIGYIRIPHFTADYYEAEEFVELIASLEEYTDALVVDILNNPGGSLFYMYALASMLTDKPLPAPKHRIALTQEEVHTAVAMLPYIRGLGSDDGAREILGEMMGGYPVDLVVAKNLERFCDFIISEWNQGHLVTDPIHVWGVDDIDPHPHAHYTKPILMLTNALCFSGADFFPSIMQDNHRALIMGERTAGAGGYIIRTYHPNQLGVRGFSVTGSIAEREDFTPLENLGVRPDVPYRITVDDLQNEYRGYLDAIRQQLLELLR